MGEVGTHGQSNTISGEQARTPGQDTSPIPSTQCLHETGAQSEHQGIVYPPCPPQHTNKVMVKHS